MHELAVAEALVGEAVSVARRHGARRITRIVARIGLLSGVEALLLERAFTVARAGSCAADAKLEIETGRIEVHCRTCGARSDAAANRLVCATCGDWRVDVTGGEELLLMSVELSEIDGDDSPSSPSTGSADEHARRTH